MKRIPIKFIKDELLGPLMLCEIPFVIMRGTGFTSEIGISQEEAVKQGFAAAVNSLYDLASLIKVFPITVKTKNILEPREVKQNIICSTLLDGLRKQKVPIDLDGSYLYFRWM
jgi:hypothetical protein